MRIATFRVDNYKSFATSGEVRFEPGFNVIVGQNNVGKTALTEALSLTLSAQPHRSQRTIPFPSDLPDLHTRVTVSFVFEADEFVRAVLAHPHEPNALRRHEGRPEPF